MQVTYIERIGVIMWKDGLPNENGYYWIFMNTLPHEIALCSVVNGVVYVLPNTGKGDRMEGADPGCNIWGGCGRLRYVIEELTGYVKSWQGPDRITPPTKDPGYLPYAEGADW